ncbi:hypothetical protein ACOMCU_25110 [Lysinibacillus sp. UGB7]|uniref:hypothetical protein n=1 Tax=Lysinibacillus sp. UGB7 TaxID=3411039 RepID=UPI003B7BCD22
MAKTSIDTGWCVEGLKIIPEDRACSACGEHISDEDQETKGGWFDFDKNGEVGFVHLNCYLAENQAPMLEGPS